MYVGDSRVFLPLGALVTDQLDDQVIWFLQLDAKGVKAALAKIPGHIQGLASPEAAVRQEARQGLMYYAHLSLAPLKQELQRAKDAAYRVRLKEVLIALRMWEDLAKPDSWRNLPFLLSLGFYPNEVISRQARDQVVALLAPTLVNHALGKTLGKEAWKKELLQWVRDHPRHLRWDPKKGQFAIIDDDK